MSERERACAERRDAGAAPPTRLASAQTATTRQIGPYLLHRELGRGANGVVYLAQRGPGEERFALKVLLHARDEETILRFRREAATTARLEAPGIVRTLDFGQDGGRLYYVMEFCQGETLKDRLRQGPLPPAQAATLVAELAEAMAAAHQFGVIHRDLKPSNILLEPETLSPRVTDFGLARDYIQERLTRTGDILGTPVYMAPEQVNGRSDLDHRVDVYSLGVLLYEILSGRVPFYARDLSALAKQIEAGRVTPLTELVPGLPAELVLICARAMAPQRDDRFATASALATALRKFVAESKPPAPPLPLQPPAGDHPSSPAWAWAALGVAILACCALAFVLATSAAPKPQASPPRDLEVVRAEARASAQREEIERILLEVELQEREGAPTLVLLRQLTRALAIAEGDQAATLQTRISRIELAAQEIEEARAELSALERRNALFAPLTEIEPALSSFSAAHPKERLPKDLAKRFMNLKKRVAGRSVLADFVQSMSDPPTLEQLVTLFGKGAEWGPFNPPLSEETYQHTLRGIDALLRVNKDHPTLLLFRGLVQYRLEKVDQAREAWKIVFSGYDHHYRRRLVHEFFELGLMTQAETEALRDVARGG